MAEKIKKELSKCSNNPRCATTDACLGAGRLIYVIESIKSLSNEKFLKVYEFAKRIDLPKGFLEKLESQYKERF